MRRYQLFYHPKLLGDVLMVLFVPSAQATRHVKTGNVAIIYHDERMIGLNLFDMSAIVKIHASGLIYNPPPVLIKIINDHLANLAIDVYLPPYQSGFLVGRIVKSEGETYQLDLGKRLAHAKGPRGLSEGSHIVVALPETLLPDGTFVSTGADEVAIMRIATFDATLDQRPLIVETKAIPGQEYFH